MITTSNLRAFTLKSLAQMAKQRGITGWHSMKKDELIRVLARKTRSSNGRNKSANGTAIPKARANSKIHVTPSNRTSRKAKLPVPSRPSAVARKIQQTRKQTERQKDLSSNNAKGKGLTSDVSKDRVILMVRDPYWLHTLWEISSGSIDRARAAMAEHWHTATPVLRLFEIAAGNTTSAIESVLRDIPIHGGVNNWYIDVKDPPKGYRVDIGYLATNGRFHCIAHSNSVITPPPGTTDAVDENWVDLAENCERIFALSGGYSQDHATMAGEIQELFEERLRRPLGSPMVTRYGLGAQSFLDTGDDFQFQIDAAMIVFGSTRRDAHVTIGGEPVRLKPDGSFAVRLSLPDRRQVVPIIASTSDGTKQQTIVLAVERNTKFMEPVLRDTGE